MKEDDVMPFGRHGGKKMRDVPREYLKWLLLNKWAKHEPIDSVIRYAREKFVIDAIIDALQKC